ncbi:alternative ribosome rescue factor ArfA [Hahella sp. SMD15-11]|uniref:Alternative ribosome rescue factor ArfA n=1 Tax=Thermohahella caldifontis TaxID=3142973 RepID=A0AB39UZ27_9GAMM
MARKKRKPIEESAVKAVVRTPLFRMRVVQNRKAYTRKGRQSWQADNTSPSRFAA